MKNFLNGALAVFLLGFFGGITVALAIKVGLADLSLKIAEWIIAAFK